jgi:hypothetical protein
MKLKILFIVALALAVITSRADSTDGKKPSAIQWKPYDCSSTLMLPKGQFDASQFGKGKYRIDNARSYGHFNNIYIIFQVTNSLSPASVTNASESSFTVKDQKVTWRSFKTVVEGRPVIRKEALMPNILPHEKKGNDSDYIWLRIDADSQELLDKITPAAEEIIRDAATGGGKV